MRFNHSKQLYIYAPSVIRSFDPGARINDKGMRKLNATEGARTSCVATFEYRFNVKLNVMTSYDDVIVV